MNTGTRESPSADTARAQLPAELRASRASSWERLPNLLMGIIALFLGVFWASVTVWPQQAFPEYAARWQMLLAALALLAVGAVYAQGLTLGAAMGPLVALSLMALLGALVSRFPWAGTDWRATLLQGLLMAIVGACFSAHFARRQFGGLRRLALGVLLFFVALALFYLLDSAHQQIVRFPREVRHLQETANSDFDWLLLDALQRGRVSARFGNPNVLAGVLCMLWPVLIAGWIAARKPAARLGLSMIVGGAMPALLWATGSRGGLLTAFGVWVLCLLVWRTRLLTRRMGREAVFGIFAGGLIALAVSVATPKIEAMAAPGTEGNADTGRFSRPSTVTMRLGFLRTGWEMLNEAPLFGNGPGSFEALYPRFQEPGIQESKFAHHWPLQFSVEAGVLGGLLPGLLVAVVAPLALWWRRRRFWDGLADTFANNDTKAADWIDTALLVRLMPLALLLVGAAFWGNGLVEITTYMREPHLLAMGTLGLAAGWGLCRATSSRNANADSTTNLDSLAIGIALFILLPLGWGWNVHRHTMALSAIAAGRQGPMLELEDRIARREPITDKTLKHEISDSFGPSVGFFPESPEIFLVVADIATLVDRAREAGLIHLPPGSSWLEESHPEEAVKAALRLNPDSAALHARLAALQKDRAAALKLIGEAIRLHPAKPDYRYQAALILLGEGFKGVAASLDDLERAESYLRAAIDREYRANKAALYEQRLAEVEAALAAAHSAADAAAKSNTISH